MKTAELFKYKTVLSFEVFPLKPTSSDDTIYAIDQIVDLISQGVDGIHLYTMNKPYIAQKIYEAVFRLIAA